MPEGPGPRGAGAEQWQSRGLDAWLPPWSLALPYWWGRRVTSSSGGFGGPWPQEIRLWHVRGGCSWEVQGVHTCVSGCTCVHVFTCLCTRHACMCVCAHMYLHARGVCPHVSVCQTCVCVYIHVCMCQACACVCMHEACVCACACVHQACVYVHMSAYTRHVCVRVCVREPRGCACLHVCACARCICGCACVCAWLTECTGRLCARAGCCVSVSPQVGGCACVCTCVCPPVPGAACPCSCPAVPGAVAVRGAEAPARLPLPSPPLRDRRQLRAPPAGAAPARRWLHGRGGGRDNRPPTPHPAASQHRCVTTLLHPRAGCTWALGEESLCHQPAISSPAQSWLHPGAAASPALDPPQSQLHRGSGRESSCITNS